MRIVAADCCVLNAPIARSRGRLLLLLLAAGFIAFGLLGCAANDAEQAGSVPNARPYIPLPKRALLAPPKEPACALKGPGGNNGNGRTERGPAVVASPVTREPSDQADAARGAQSSSGTASQPDRTLVQTGPNASLSQRITLEYERDCYQQAELRVRHRLLRLQAAIGSTMRAVRQPDRSAPN